jgi:hypothetical protein
MWKLGSIAKTLPFSRPSKTDGTTELELGVTGYLVIDLSNSSKPASGVSASSMGFQRSLRTQNTRHDGRYEA